MKKPNNWDKAQPITETERLPVDGYVIEILGAKEEAYEWGEVLVLRFDISEGNYKGFYQKNYDNQSGEDKKWKGSHRVTLPPSDSKEDDLSIRIFKSMVNAFEDSNNKFKFDWSKSIEQFKGLKVGLVFQDKEFDFDGKNGWYTAPYSFKTVNQIKEGDFKIPDKKQLDENKKQATTNNEPEDDSDVPF